MSALHGGRRAAHPAGVIDFSSNVNCYGPPEGVLGALGETSADDISSYPDPGYPLLKDAIAAHTGRAPEEVFLANGSVETFYCLANVLRPERMLVVSPCFSEYALAGLGAGARVLEHFLKPGDGFAFDAGKAAEAAAEADLVFVANPGSPTGRLVEREALLELARCLKRGAVMVVDEAFMEFCEERESRTLLPHVSERIWVSRSLTKFFSLAGLRIGYLVAPGDTVARLESRTPPWRVNRLAEKAAVAALSDDEFIRTVPPKMARERERFSALMEGTGSLRAFPSAANFILLQIESAGLDAPGLKGALLPRGFLIRDASNFSGLSERFIRLAVRQEADNVALAREIGAFTQGSGPS